MTQRAQAVFREMADKIADIECRVAEAVQIKVEQVDSLPADDHLIGVEIAMDSRRRRFRRGVCEPLAGEPELFDAMEPCWFVLDHNVEALPKNAQLVVDGVAAPVRNG